MLPESRSASHSTTARDHLSQVIAEYGAEDPARRDVVLDLTGDEIVLVLPDSEPTSPSPGPAGPTGLPPSPPAVVPPVLNRARYRRRGVAGVSTLPGELSELVTLADEPHPPVATSTDPDVLSLVRAAQRRPRRPAGAEPTPSRLEAPTLPVGLPDPDRETARPPGPPSMTAALDAILEATRSLADPPTPVVATTAPSLDDRLFPDLTVRVAGPLRIPSGEATAEVPDARSIPAPSFVASPVTAETAPPSLAPPA